MQQGDPSEYLSRNAIRWDTTNIVFDFTPRAVGRVLYVRDIQVSLEDIEIVVIDTDVWLSTTSPLLVSSKSYLFPGISINLNRFIGSNTLWEGWVNYK